MGKNLELLEKEEIAQELVPRIQKNETEPLRQFLEVFSDDIYNFSIRYYNFDDDDAGDFYLYAFEHLQDGKKLKSFKFKSKFTTWFFSVLRNMIIDFLRTQKNKIYTTSFARTDGEGNVIDVSDSIPDTHSLEREEPEFIEKFKERLMQMKVMHRVLLKLAYAHYLDITKEEFSWLVEKSGKPAQEVLSIIDNIKNIGHKKAGEVRKIEDKLTANYQSISYLESKIGAYLNENPTIKANSAHWNEDFQQSDMPPEIIEYIQRLSKKKKKHTNLLKMQEKSLLSTRIPYKELVPLLGSSEGVLSVQLLRVIEKLGQGISILPE